MPPQTTPTAPSSTGSLDPQAVAMAKAIRQTESGGNFSAKGKSGEYGAYQYTEPTWAKDSSAAGVNVPLSQASPEQQNQVAYTKIKALKDRGLNVGQVASSWNAGEGEADAYTGKFSNGQPSVGVNKYGVHFDVPAYAKSVATAYQTLKQGGDVQADPNNPSSTANQTPVEPPKQQSLQPGEATALEHTDPSSHSLENVLTGIFPGTKQIGESLGTAAVNIGKFIHGKNPDVPVDIPKTIGGYLEAGSQVAAPGMGAETTLGRIGTTAGLGATAGTGSALASGKTKGADIAKQGVIGGLVGGAVGGAGELISKASQYLPYRIARTFLPGTSPETAQYAVDKGLGSPTTMLKGSESSLASIGSKIESALSSPALDGVTAGPQEVYSSIIDKYPEAGLTMDNVGDELKKLVPLQKGLIDRLEDGGLNPAELNQLKSAIGQATYKSVFDEPAVKAGKQIGNAAYAAMSDWLKETLPAIRSDAPDVTPLFDDYTKELQLNGALQKAIRSGEKARPLTLRDIMALLGGSATFGPVGGLGAYAVEKAATNPTVNLATGGLLNKLNGPALGGLLREGVVNSIPRGK